MELTKSKFDEIYAKHKFWIDDPERAFEFVHDILAAEADAVEQRDVHLFGVIRRLNDAAYEVFNISSDISNECFGGQDWRS
jgi:hypothetical protein